MKERIEEALDRLHRAGHNQVERVAALEECLTPARTHEGERWFDAGAWSEDLADSYLALAGSDDAVRTISGATRSGHAEGAEMLCELAEKLMRSGYDPQARLLWQQARAGYLDDVWIYVQADIGYGDIGDAAQVMSGADRSAVAGDVEDALQGLGIEELDTRAGYRPDRGYVHPAEAADEILDEALQPFLDDLQRKDEIYPRSNMARRASILAVVRFSGMTGWLSSNRSIAQRLAGS